MPPGTNRACPLAPSLYRPVYRDARVCEKPTETNNIAAAPTCQLPKTGAFAADHAFKEVGPTPI
jgi:hypothetical protein